MGDKRNVCMLLLGRPEGKKPLERKIRRWVENGEIGWGCVGWIGLAQDRDK
jgi:hypothetical protein